MYFVWNLCIFHEYILHMTRALTLTIDKGIFPHIPRFRNNIRQHNNCVSCLHLHNISMLLCTKQKLIVSPILGKCEIFRFIWIGKYWPFQPYVTTTIAVCKEKSTHRILMIQCKKAKQCRDICFTNCIH